MIVRRAVWHTLEPTAMVRRDGWANTRSLRDTLAHPGDPPLRPGEVVTVLEPEHDDALAILSTHFDVSIVEEQ